MHHFQAFHSQLHNKSNKVEFITVKPVQACFVPSKVANEGADTAATTAGTLVEFDARQTQDAAAHMQHGAANQAAATHTCDLTAER
jgi:hypothetical protein